MVILRVLFAFTVASGEDEVLTEDLATCVPYIVPALSLARLDAGHIQKALETHKPASRRLLVSSSQEFRLIFSPGLTGAPTHPPTHSLTHSLARSLARSLTHSLTHGSSQVRPDFHFLELLNELRITRL